MMKNKLLIWQSVGFVFVGIAGVLLHFLFDWTGENVVAALFSPVNESIWEHTKLLFFPMLVIAVVQKRFMEGEYQSFWCIKLIGMLLGIAMIPVLYYTINGVLGSTPDWVNIAIFFIAAAASCSIEYRLFRQSFIYCRYPEKAVLILCLIAVTYAVLTFIPPQIPLFRDPVTGTYGF